MGLGGAAAAMGEGRGVITPLTTLITSPLLWLCTVLHPTVFTERIPDAPLRQVRRCATPTTRRQRDGGEAWRRTLRCLEKRAAPRARTLTLSVNIIELCDGVCFSMSPMLQLSSSLHGRARKRTEGLYRVDLNLGLFM